MDLKEKISKLLKLAENNPSEEEAASALAKATELAQQHGLDLAIQADPNVILITPMDRDWETLITY